MSLIFLDDEQRFFKQPAEVWQIIFNYCLEPDTHQSSSLRALRIVFAAVSKEFNKLIKKVLTKSPHPYRQLRLANYLCTYGYTSLLQYALANGLRVVTDALSIASQKGYLDCLKVLADHGCKMCPAIIDDAALKGHRHVVEYLVEERRIRPIDTTMKNAVLSGQVDLVKYLQKYVVLRAYADIGRDATASGSLDMVKYIEQIVPLEQKNIIASAQNGSIAILQYYIDKGFALNDHLLCLTAVVNRHLNYVKLAIDHGAPLSEELMQGVTKMNDVEFMKELRARGCPWNGSSIKQAAADGRLKALEFLIDNGCPFTENTDSSWIRYGFTYSLASKNDATVMTSYGGHFECLKYLMEHSAPWPNDLINKVFFMSTKANTLAIVKYLHERGCPWDAKTCSDAVARGYFELLKYLHQNRCPWDKRTCEIAALMGRADMLKYAIENKCPLDNETMTRALESGSLEVLKLVHESGIPLPSDACTRLLVRGTPDALKYAHENGGQWAADSVRKALEHVTNESTMLPRLIYAFENGCPWDPKEALALVKKNYCLNISEWIQHNAMTD